MVIKHDWINGIHWIHFLSSFLPFFLSILLSSSPSFFPTAWGHTSNAQARSVTAESLLLCPRDDWASHVDPPKKIQKTSIFIRSFGCFSHFFTDILCTFSFFHVFFHSPKNDPHFFQLWIPQVGHPFPDKGHLQARVNVPTFPGEVWWLLLGSNGSREGKLIATRGTNGLFYVYCIYLSS